MAEAAFLVVDVPADGTVLGDLTRRHPGLEVDLVGRPDASGDVHAYLLDYIVGPIQPEAREEAAARLAPLYDEFDAITAGPDSWHVRGRVPLASIQVPALRMIAGLYGLTQAPWLVLRDGRARAVLRPREEASAEMLASLVRARLAQLGVEGQVSLEWLDAVGYEARRRRLDGPPDSAAAK